MDRTKTSQKNEYESGQNETLVIQREIKFRAWESRFKEMYYTDKDAIILPSYGFYETSNFVKVTHAIGGSRSDIAIGYQHGELMQFTGLKDKNGKEIYEGDILEVEGLCMIVEYFQNLARFGYSNEGYLHNLNSKITTVIKVVGNIYENPKLVV